MPLKHQRVKISIRYCEHPTEGVDPQSWVPPSWNEALDHIPERQHDGIKAKMLARREVLKKGDKLRSPDHWNTEAKLPNNKHFYAIKANKIRAYGWFSGQYNGVFYISHFTFKEGEKLAKKDHKRVIANWRKIEEKRG